jgi:hypothetical protein
MFAKLLFIILVLGATACALLVIRQQRFDTVHEMSVIHQRLLGHERTLCELRSEIAKRCRPNQVRLAMNELGGTWVPIPASPPPYDQRQIRLASQQTDAPPR